MVRGVSVGNCDNVICSRRHGRTFWTHATERMYFFATDQNARMKSMVAKYPGRDLSRA